MIDDMCEGISPAHRINGPCEISASPHCSMNCMNGSNATL